jgi:hypothetical protein
MSKPVIKGPELRRVRAIALPYLSLGFDRARKFRVDSPMVAWGHRVKRRTVVGVTDLETQAPLQLVLDDALRAILNDSYPGGGYVGKSFEVTCHKRVPPKRAHTYSVFELAT